MLKAAVKSLEARGYAGALLASEVMQMTTMNKHTAHCLDGALATGFGHYLSLSDTCSCATRGGLSSFCTLRHDCTFTYSNTLFLVHEATVSTHAVVVQVRA